MSSPKTFEGLLERIKEIEENKNGISWYLSLKKPKDCEKNMIGNKEVKKIE